MVATSQIVAGRLEKAAVKRHETWVGGNRNQVYGVSHKAECYQGLLRPPAQ